MPGWLFAVIVIVFLAVAIPLVRSMKGAIVERLPLAEGEQVVLEEEGLTISHCGQKRAAAGGWTKTSKVRSVLTDRRIILATGGPEGSTSS